MGSYVTNALVDLDSCIGIFYRAEMVYKLQRISVWLEDTNSLPALAKIIKETSPYELGSPRAAVY